MVLLHLRNIYFAMIFIVVLSNYLVLFPINDWLTWGTFAYPISFLITELTNRFYGAPIARRVVYIGFIFAAILSFWISTPRIAVASLTAFFTSQLLDILIFNRLRNLQWWYAPFFSSLCASFIDTVLFFGVAFGGEPLPYMTWAIGDFGVKFLMDLLMLTPFRLAIRRAPKLVLLNKSS